MRNDVRRNGAESVPARSVKSRSEPDRSETVHGDVSPGGSTAATIVVIERRALLRDCLTKSFEAALGSAVISFPSVENWVEVMDPSSACVIVLSVGGRSANTESTQREISLLNRVANQRPIILLADTEEPSQIVEALQSGTRGYIPTSVSLAIAIEAMRLVRAGGVYAPAASVIAANCKNSPAKNGTGTRNVMFTERQTAILDKLCKGKPNKIIAYELGMCESTVKVHVRNIMKKLKATNRTQIAYLVRELMNQSLNRNETDHSFLMARPNQPLALDRADELRPVSVICKY